MEEGSTAVRSLRILGENAASIFLAERKYLDALRIDEVTGRTRIAAEHHATGLMFKCLRMLFAVLCHSILELTIQYPLDQAQQSWDVADRQTHANTQQSVDVHIEGRSRGLRENIRCGHDTSAVVVTWFS